MVMPVELRVRQAYHHGCSDDGLQRYVSCAATTGGMHCIGGYICDAPTKLETAPT
jgi:hypothetical protein